MGIFDFFRRKHAPTPAAYWPDVTNWVGTPTNLVGESIYQDALWKVVNPKGDGVRRARDDRYTQVRVKLAHESNNAYDSNAVVATIGGDVVGYLSRDIAPTYAPLLTTSGRTFEGAIKGGFRLSNGELADLGVEVMLPPPEVLRR